jgi:hypothetical protein
MTNREAVAVLESAVLRCATEDLRTPEMVLDTVSLLES